MRLLFRNLFNTYLKKLLVFNTTCKVKANMSITLLIIKYFALNYVEHDMFWYIFIRSVSLNLSFIFFPALQNHVDDDKSFQLSKCKRAFCSNKSNRIGLTTNAVQKLSFDINQTFTILFTILYRHHLPLGPIIASISPFSATPETFFRIFLLPMATSISRKTKSISSVIC